MLAPDKLDWHSRFWEKVDKRAPDECWPWTGSRTAQGYGKMQVWVASRGTWIATYAHRLAFEMEYGSFPESVDILHSCDNPPCTNPAHLRIGSQRDNVMESVVKGRWVRRRTTVTERAEIRKRYAAGGMTQQELGEEYGLWQANICQIINGTDWYRPKVRLKTGSVVE